MRKSWVGASTTSRRVWGGGSGGQFPFVCFDDIKQGEERGFNSWGFEGRGLRRSGRCLTFDHPISLLLQTLKVSGIKGRGLTFWGYVGRERGIRRSGLPFQKSQVWWGGKKEEGVALSSGRRGTSPYSPPSRPPFQVRWREGSHLLGIWGKEEGGRSCPLREEIDISFSSSLLAFIISGNSRKMAKGVSSLGDMREGVRGIRNL